ncbi:MAG: HNH endonuclease [Campylobacterales bacterium]|nr:HNH endonuclease [Campylobacterales bacterium]
MNIQADFQNFIKNKDSKYNSKFQKFNTLLEKVFNEEDNSLIEKIIFADHTTMENYIKKYKNYLRTNNHDFISIETLCKKENEPTNILKELLELYNYYKTFLDRWNYQIVKELNINTCCYCNRESVLVFNKDKKEMTTAEMDHFYPRSLYPFLSISIFNLIPSCKTCNSKLKGDLDTGDMNKSIIYPYEDSFNDKAKFKLNIEKSNFYEKENGFNLQLEILNNNKKAKRTKDLFKLEELYQNHKDIVLELIQKEYIYNDSYTDEIFKNYEGTLFKNKEDLQRLITCGYVEDKDLHKRPLSKLIKDISKELDVI